MGTRRYDQACGLAHALELVGDRWALLVVRDLLLRPKRFTELRRGMPRIPSNVLSARLKELEGGGIVRRRVLPRPEGYVVYELTEYGRELEDIILRLGLWGTKTMGEPGPDDTINIDSLLLGLRATFRPEAARGAHVSYELHLGELVAHARIDGGTLEVGEGPLEGADLVIETDLALRSLISRDVSVDEALEAGTVRIAGDRDRLAEFVELFHIPQVPSTAPA